MTIVEYVVCDVCGVRVRADDGNSMDSFLRTHGWRRVYVTCPVPNDLPRERWGNVCPNCNEFRVALPRVRFNPDAREAGNPLGVTIEGKPDFYRIKGGSE